MLHSATSYSPSLPEAGTGECSLTNQVSPGEKWNFMPTIFSASNHSKEKEDG